jgi:hypothetical protein
MAGVAFFASAHLRAFPICLMPYRTSFSHNRLFPVWGASVSDLAFGCQRKSHAPVSHTLVSCHASA